jgi:hypothetical protein
LLEPQPQLMRESGIVAPIWQLATAMDVQTETPSRSEADSRVISGWAALERGDLEEARSALSDVYSTDPAHPALPLLAAGIRRIRPRRFPWRGVFLLLLAIGGGAFVVYARTRQTSPQPNGTEAVASLAPAQLDGEVPAPAATSPGPTGTSGTNKLSAAPPDRDAAIHSPATEDTQIRQAVSRFAAAYSNRWTPLTFASCDIARGDETASVTCQSRSADARGATWTFSFRKVDDMWKIVSMQPPTDSTP